MKKSKCLTLKSIRSYFGVRTKQEAAGFLTQDENQMSHCIRESTLYEDIKCPEGQYILTKPEFERSCEAIGMKCPHDYPCYCRPCVKAFEVAVYQQFEGSNTTTVSDGCEKMSLCATIEQTKTLYIDIDDHRKRVDPVVEVDIYLDSQTVHIDVSRHPTKPFTYEFTWQYDYTQIGIMNVFFNGEQIPQSPVRIQVVDRQCEIDFPGQKRQATSDGDCACGEGSMEVSGKCVESTIMAIVISIAAVILVTCLGICYVRYRNHKNDEMWQVNLDELTFDDPPEVIGQGSFGVVLLGQYRGTKVALKRALKLSSRGSKQSSKNRSGTVNRSKLSGGHSKGSNDNKTDSIGMSSDDNGSSQQSLDPEQGVNDAGEESSCGSRSLSAQGTQSYGRSGHSSYDLSSLGFLAKDFGPTSKWAWLFPWAKRDNYHFRFKEAILGSSGSNSIDKTWHGILCPCFDTQAKAEEAFMVEMRVLSRLRHPCITTVLGAVISRSHDPMLVSKYTARIFRRVGKCQCSSYPIFFFKK